MARCGSGGDGRGSRSDDRADGLADRRGDCHRDGPHTVTRSAGLVACAPSTRAPMVNEDAEEPAACNGRAVTVCQMPSSSRLCAPSGSWAKRRAVGPNVRSRRTYALVEVCPRDRRPGAGRGGQSHLSRFTCLAGEIGLFGVGLGADRDVLPGGHRHRAPATDPAVAATITADLDAPVADTPTIRLAVETIPSFAPSTAARSHPMRSDRCSSRSKDFLPQET